MPAAETGSVDPTRMTPARIAINLLLFLVAVFWFSKNQSDADLWGHVRYGDDLLRTGVVPQTDPYSYTAGNLPWYNHEILAEIILALLARIGSPAILWWKILTGVAILGLACTLSRTHQIGALAWFLMATIVISCLSMGWAPRPQILSYLFFAILLWLMDRGGKRPWMLLVAIPLMIAWVNAHGGFLFGLGIFGIYLFCRIIDELYFRDFGFGGRIAWFVVIGLLTLATVLVNPYGPGMITGLIRELGIPRPQVREWGPLPWTSTEYSSINVLVLIAVAATLGTRLPMPWHQRVLLAVMVVETQMHVRHVVFLAIAALAWLPGHFQSVLDRFGERLLPSLYAEFPEPEAETPERIPGPWLAAIGIAAIGMSIAILLRTLAIEVPRKENPVDALQFVADRRLSGKMVTPLNWGQYVIDALYPQIRVSFDGRYGTVYDERLLDINYDLWFPLDPTNRFRYRSPTAPPFDPKAILELNDPNLALIDPGYPQAATTLANAADWILLYEDPVALIYGRRRIYDDPASPDYLSPSNRIRRTKPPIGWVPYPAKPTPLRDR